MSTARILVVDDEQATREVFAELLQHWGYEVDQTADGHEALKLAAERHPDVIVSDLVMPKLDGLALVRALREEQPDTPVVIITGRGTIDAAVEAIREGVFDFVMKMTTKELLGALDQEKAQAQQAIQALINRYDYHEHGGAPLLGIDGICIICHGSSGEKAIKNAVGVAARYARSRLNQTIVQELASGPLQVSEED